MGKPQITFRVDPGKKASLEDEIEADPRYDSVSHFLQTEVDEYLDDRDVSLGDVLAKARDFHGGDNQ